MNCSNCNQEIKDDAVYCLNCGAELRSNTISAASAQTANAPLSMTKTPRNKKKTIAIGIGLLLLLLVIIVGSLAFFAPKSSLNGQWRLTGYLEGGSGGLNLDLPNVDLTVSDESFEMHIAGEQAVIMLFGIGGSDPVDLTIQGTLTLIEESAEEKKYRVTFASITPSDQMIEDLEAIYGSRMDGVSLEELFSESLETTLAGLEDYTINLCVPVNGFDASSGVEDWYFELIGPQGLVANFGLRFISDSDDAKTFQVFGAENGQEQIINEGTWSLSESNEIALSFPYSDTDADLAHISVTHESN